ncbi:PAAR domain-containing protein [Paenibacillus bouchesdurhonensis]|uniref:PAAR domain-containing protein n=1 Tax=Paenibacillus bouchesdurhonensis TaxID=1870990 RepID=UPI000DA62F41|nr:PAAR domain-containing protein [Paenibacillus bouchesdurhonensis]
MPGVAIHGSEIYEVIKPGHVTYDIERYVEPWGPDENGNSGGGDWVYDRPDSTGAKITGTVVATISNMKVSGVNVAKVGDKTSESWTAFPPIPSDTRRYRYIATSAAQGSGQGKIISGSNRGKLNGKSIALIGSTVETCLGTITTIKTGSDKMKFNS